MKQHFFLLWVEPLCSSVTHCDFTCPRNKGLPTHGHFHVGRAINSPLTGRNNAPSLKRQCLFTVNSRSDAMVTAEYTKPWAEVTHTCDLDLCRSSLTHTSFQELEIPPRGQSANYTWHQRQGAWTPVGKMQINVLFSTIWSSNRRNYGCHKKIKIWLLMSPQIYGNTWIWEEINTWMERRSSIKAWTKTSSDHLVAQCCRGVLVIPKYL